MSFTISKRNKIKYYILEKMQENCGNVAAQVSETFGISVNTVYRYLKEMENDNIIQKKGKIFSLVESSDAIALRLSETEKLEEDRVYSLYIKKYMAGLPDNVKKIWQYSFMEMMNNAIEHSKAENIKIGIFQNYMCTVILILDDGIGIFKKIKEYYNYSTLDEAVKELFKGKLTTDSENHSGEGIFFTSRILDRFAAISDGAVFTHDKYSEIVSDLNNLGLSDSWNRRKGTIIWMELSNFSNKILKEVFDMFSDVDGGFNKTKIPIKNMFDTYPVSRSQAKRLCNRFDRFTEIVLDFDGIDEIGQGFAHEIFVVFQRNHPDIKFTLVNVAEDVNKMINHVKLS